MSRVIIPDGLTGKALFQFLTANKKQLIAQKKAGIKYTDSVVCQPSIISKTKFATTKSKKDDDGDGNDSELEIGTLHVKVVGNTAWWCDSQMDILTDTCYDKSISEKGTLIPHIADHVHTSTNHVGDVTAVYTQKLSLKDLGLTVPGTTTAFIMETDVREDYNEDTYKFYKNGKINQHSIGLCYVSIGLCINDKDDLPHYDLWKKYYDKVINKEVIDERGYFWIVPEIKIMENSCVLFGSNILTPTLEVTDTGNEPPEGTHKHQPSSTDNNKQMAICPSCAATIQVPEQGPVSCPSCGQFVSPSNNAAEVPTFDVLAAIAQTKFI